MAPQHVVRMMVGRNIFHPFPRPGGPERDVREEIQRASKSKGSRRPSHSWNQLVSRSRDGAFGGKLRAARELRHELIMEISSSQKHNLSPFFFCKKGSNGLNLLRKYIYFCHGFDILVMISALKKIQNTPTDIQI